MVYSAGVGIQVQSRIYQEHSGSSCGCGKSVCLRRYSAGGDHIIVTAVTKTFRLGASVGPHISNTSRDMTLPEEQEAIIT